MVRIGMACVVFVAAGITIQPDDAAKKATVKKLAQEIGEATLKGDHGKLMDHTYDGVIKQLGGREKAIAAIDTIMQSMKSQGITIKSFKVGEPGEFLSEGGNTFVVVPTGIEMTFPGGKA